MCVCMCVCVCVCDLGHLFHFVLIKERLMKVSFRNMMVMEQKGIG